MGADLRRRVAQGTTATAVAMVGLRALASCATTPDLEFVSDASTFDVTTLMSDAPAFDVSEGAADDDAEVLDAAADARRDTCPDATPPNVDQCCDRVRCVGKGCNAARCDDCTVCAASSVCCIRKAGAAAVCAASIGACR